MILGKKQKELNDNFVKTWNNIEHIVDKKVLDKTILITLKKMKGVLKNRMFGLAWSGGKDSVVVKFLLDQITRDYPSCIGMTKELEYPEFMRYVTNNMPEDLNVYTTEHTIEWLRENPEMLFPKNSVIAKKWFKEVQHKSQNTFFKEKKLDILVTGRRLKDSNWVGKQGYYKNNSTGVVRYSPIFNWSHEMVLACMKYYNLPFAPFYKWVNGWVVGSGCWSARQWTGDINNAWQEVYSIDPNIVLNARLHFKSADYFVRSLGF